MRRRHKRLLVKIVRVTVITIIFSFITLEVVMRTQTDKSPDGVVSYRGMILRPLQIPVSEIEADIENYLNNQETARTLYDSELGWRLAPDLQGSMVTNSAGLRSNTEYSLEVPEGVTRIALFGDSFVMGAEVEDNETFAAYLDGYLQACDAPVEVLNFGVGGYGMDQAYLYYQTAGADYNPDIVIFGLQMENLGRNVNLARPVLGQTGIPFTKPRFVSEDGELELINSPTVPPEEIVALYENFEAWDLFDYEWHYDERYESEWMHASILYRIIQARNDLLNQAQIDFEMGEERVELGLEIIEQFADSVEANGSEFMMLHLPTLPVVAYYLQEGDLPYQAIIDELNESYPVIPSEVVFEEVIQEDWQPQNHYSPQANQRVGEFAAQWLIDTFDTIECGK